MHLHALLKNIQAGKAINFAQLVKKLPVDSKWQRFLAPEMVAKNKHIVSITDADTFNALLVRSLPPDSRQQAASHSYASSHAVKCESAYLLCYPANKMRGNDFLVDSERVLTAAVVLDKITQPLSFTPSKTAILIENQDCFFSYTSLLKHFQQLDLPNSDIYFSAGSRIQNAAFGPILTQYSALQCIFDYDYAGLQIALALRASGYANTQYLVPDDIAALQALFTFVPNSTAQYVDMLSTCAQLGLDELGKVIANSKRFMEQEALLTLPQNK